MGIDVLTDKLGRMQFIRKLRIVAGAILFARLTSAQSSGSFSSSFKPYDIIMAYIGTLPGSQPVLLMTFDRAVIFQGNLAGSAGSCGTNPTATATFTVNQNSSPIGTIVVSTGGAVTFTTTGGAAQQFAIGDILQVDAPSMADATLANIAFTLSGRRLGA
jgi:hypothetical protein